MKTSDIVIEAKNLSIGYANRHKQEVVHSQLDFCLYRGELTCLLGANGAGKSTLLRTLAGVQKPLRGELKLLGQPIQNYSEKERSRTIGIVLTDKTQAGGLTVRELVALGRQPHTGFFGRLNLKDNEIIDYALDAVGIAHKASKYTAELSDGERQKVMIAKALVQECPLILLDEPTAFLDVVSRIEIMHLLHQLAQKEQKAILLSTHDIEQALVLADKLWLMTDANGLECGVTEDIILNNRMDTLFPEKDIRFDLTHGIYSPTVKGNHSLYLTADNETLRHWAQNALNRNGYLCHTPEKNTSSDNDSFFLHINENHILTLHRSNKSIEFNSFEALLDAIKEWE
ncbi:ABC transporter ATP-binding protein [uncultured Bacteroides sp.]|uniref:ABC transporter ATP-binding protein n=1 Tax=uncultured Bacteroides sp. TaxID=162156 RepID=UPI00262A962F|nr:ABC transporter ATP-binding protein [uncultured Bacteroides sp.]